MTIDKARAVMEQVSGGVAWTDDDDDNLWEAYGDTLGVPDYQTRPGQPGPLHHVPEVPG